MNRPLGFFKQKGKNLYPVILFVLLLLTITLACSLPFRIVWNGSDEDNQQKTVQANSELVQTLSAITSNNGKDSESESNEESFAGEEIPSVTPSLTPSPTITKTPAPEQVAAFISSNTNCRVGPQDVFELIHIFLKGDNVDLIGKNEDGTFWYVQDQDGENIQCWLWNKYATPEGLTENLPVFTPPPAPIPVMNFVASYKTTTGGTTVIVNVRNTGNIALQSYSATFKDTVTSQIIAVSANKFGNATKVSVGNIGVISSPPFSASTIGHQMTATIKACSADGQAGKCATVTINFESK